MAFKLPWVWTTFTAWNLQWHQSEWVSEWMSTVWRPAGHSTCYFGDGHPGSQLHRYWQQKSNKLNAKKLNYNSDANNWHFKLEIGTLVVRLLPYTKSDFSTTFLYQVKIPYVTDKRADKNKTFRNWLVHPLYRSSIISIVQQRIHYCNC